MGVLMGSVVGRANVTVVRGQARVASYLLPDHVA